MNLTQAQVRHLVGITEEQFRSWRNAFVPLQGRSGQSPQFGLGDVLALLVIAELVETYGAKVSKLTNISTHLFHTCGQLVESSDCATLLMITPDFVKVATSDALQMVDALAFIVPLHVIRARMQTAIMSASCDDEQLSLNGI
jgi:hypothetical protein